MLCSLITYRAITHDTESYDADVIAALTKAQGLIERRTDRFLELGTYTEILRLHENGMVYPRATPLVSAYLPVGSTIAGNGLQNVLGGLVMPVALWRTRTFRWAATVTYIGGYAAGAIPDELIRVCADIAYHSLQSSTGVAGIPYGTTALHVGDVTVSGTQLARSPIISAYASGILESWKRREV